MQALSKSLQEYPVVRAMGGVGNVLAPKLIAEIGDVRRFHSGKALIAHAAVSYTHLDVYKRQQESRARISEEVF